MDSWYFLDESGGTPRPTGPFGIAQMQQMAQMGQLLPSSRVAAVGADGWVLAESDPALRGLFGVAPPLRAAGAAVASAPLADGSDYSFGAALSLGFASLKAKWAQLTVLALLAMAVGTALAAPQFVASLLADSISRRGGPSAGAMALSLGGTCFALILQVLVGLPMTGGLIYAAARVHEGEFKIGDLFIGFRRYGTALGAAALFMLIILACGVAVQIPVFLLAMLAGLGAGVSQSPAISIILALLMILTMIVLYVLLMTRVVFRVLFAPTVAIDPAYGHPGVVESFKISWRNTAGRGSSLFGLMLVAGLLALLSVLLLCIGYLLIGMPLICSVIGAAYALLFHGRSRLAPQAA